VVGGCVQIHHGNGTQQIFEEDPRVLFVSLHRRDKNFYPEVGGIASSSAWYRSSHSINAIDSARHHWHWHGP
jgi:acetoin utilization deacetylase AcuC-like enzyme